jgi:hypothetical protein
MKGLAAPLAPESDEDAFVMMDPGDRYDSTQTHTHAHTYTHAQTLTPSHLVHDKKIRVAQQQQPALHTIAAAAGCAGTTFTTLRFFVECPEKYHIAKKTAAPIPTTAPTTTPAIAPPERAAMGVDDALLPAGPALGVVCDGLIEADADSTRVRLCDDEEPREAVCEKLNAMAGAFAVRVDPLVVTALKLIGTNTGACFAMVIEICDEFSPAHEQRRNSSVGPCTLTQRLNAPYPFHPQGPTRMNPRDHPSRNHLRRLDLKGRKPQRQTWNLEHPRHQRRHWGLRRGTPAEHFQRHHPMSAVGLPIAGAAGSAGGPTT